MEFMDSCEFFLRKFAIPIFHDWFLFRMRGLQNQNANHCINRDFLTIHIDIRNWCLTIFAMTKMELIMKNSFDNTHIVNILIVG